MVRFSPEIHKWPQKCVVALETAIKTDPSNLSAETNLIFRKQIPILDGKTTHLKAGDPISLQKLASQFQQAQNSCINIWLLESVLLKLALSCVYTNGGIGMGDVMCPQSHS